MAIFMLQADTHQHTIGTLPLADLLCTSLSYAIFHILVRVRCPGGIETARYCRLVCRALRMDPTAAWRRTRVACRISRSEVPEHLAPFLSVEDLVPVFKRNIRRDDNRTQRASRRAKARRGIWNSLRCP